MIPGILSTIKVIRQEEDYVLVRWCVESLFTKLPIPETTELNRGILDIELEILGNYISTQSTFILTVKFI